MVVHPSHDSMGFRATRIVLVCVKAVGCSGCTKFPSLVTSTFALSKLI
jgi:hypothetical protein